MHKSKLLLLSMVLFSLTGCSKITSWETSGIHVTKNGNVTEAIIESFDKENYDVEELEANIKASVEEFNKEMGDKSLSLEKFQVKDQKTKVILEYNSYKEYVEFNHLGLFQGALSNLSTGDYDLETKMVPVSDGKKEKGNAKTLAEVVENSDNYQVVAFQDAIQVAVDKNIVYVSENLEVIDNKTVSLKEDAGYGFVVYES